MKVIGAKVIRLMVTSLLFTVMLFLTERNF